MSKDKPEKPDGIETPKSANAARTKRSKTAKRTSRERKRDIEGQKHKRKAETARNIRRANLGNATQVPFQLPIEEWTKWISVRSTRKPFVKGDAPGNVGLRKSLIVDEDIKVKGRVDVDGREHVYDAFAVDGWAAFHEDVAIDGNLAVKGRTDFDDAHVNGWLHVKGAFGAEGKANFHKDVEVGGKVTAIDVMLSSDAQLKRDIETIPDARDKVAQIRGVQFTRIAPGHALDDHTTCRSAGVVAQDVQAACPDLVDANGPNGTLTVNYTGITALLIEALKDLDEENRALVARIEALEATSAKRVK